MPAYGARALGLALIGVLLAGCAQTKFFKVEDGLERNERELIRVLLMPPGVELYEVTLAGLTEPQADWTATAREHLVRALSDYLEARDAAVVRYRAPLDDVLAVDPDHVQLVKLYEAVARSILVHKYNDNATLPTKEDTFDWTLGEAVAPLRQTYDADYALFVFVRDSYSSGERVALAVIVAALFGGIMLGGQQVGLASLVDLETGAVVWFNLLTSRVGELRETGPAHDTVADLLDGFPL